MSTIRLPRVTGTALVLVATLVLAITMVAPRVGAASASVEQASLTWTISDYVRTSGSLTSHRIPQSPTTLDVDTGAWTFNDPTGSFDPDTGEAHLSFPGGLEIGNTGFGDFAIRFSELELDMTASRGTLHAEVATRAPGATEFSPATSDVLIARFLPLTPSTSGGMRTWTVSPETDVAADPAFPDAMTFPHQLLDALPPSFGGFFSQTDPAGASNPTNIAKLPSDITISIGLPSSTPTTTTPTTTVPPTTTPPPSTTAPSATRKITAGGLDWGVKDNFVSYLESQGASASIDVGGPASSNPDGTFHFPLTDGGTYSSAANLSAPFSGSVHFAAHGGVLDFTITDPRVTIEGSGGSLIVDAASKDQETGKMVIYDDVVMATLDLAKVTASSSGDTVTLARVPATLTAAGAPAFGGFYAAGEALDPLTLHLEVPGGDGTLEEAGNTRIDCLATTTITAGSEVHLCGDGFIPGEQVQAFIHSDPVLLGLTTAGPDGHVDGSFQVPADTAPGTHHFELRGVSSGFSLTSVEVTVIAATGAALDTGPANGETLPATGAATTTAVIVGLVMLLAGAGLLVAERRRRPTAP